ncbi:MAG: DNA helicase, partial [Marivirga sp.]|nr:DNA helicase [Marivirga sp.]
VSERDIAGTNSGNLLKLKKVVEFALMLRPLSDSNNLHLIDPADSRSQQLEQLVSRYRQMQKTGKERMDINANWLSKLTPQDTANALLLADKYESSFFSFLNGTWRNLKKQLHRHYDFNKHSVKPSYKNILENLKAEYDAAESVTKQKQEIQTIFAISEIEGVQQNIGRVRKMREDTDLSSFLQHAEVQSLINRFAALDHVLVELESFLSKCLHDFEAKSLGELQDELDSIELNAEGLDELLPALRAYVQLPDSLKQTLRLMIVNTQQAEGIIAGKTLNSIYKQNKKFKSTDSVAIENAVQFIQAGYKQLLKINADLIRGTIRQRFLSHVELSTMALSQLNAEQRQFKKEYNEGRKILENEFGKSMRYKSIRELSGKESGLVLKDLKPVWLMSPLSVSDSLPLDTQYFDAIIFDEASQITLEEGIPSLYRAPQTIIVGDEKQMPPSNFFTAKVEDPDDLESFGEDEDELLSNDADSLLVQGARKLSSVMLGWHYRSRYETLISFSNHAFYGAGLLTIPDKTIHHSVKAPIEILKPEEAAQHSGTLFDRSISFHHLPNSVYEKRINLDEANYIAHLVKELLLKGVQESIGIVAFSQEQQHTIEDALVLLASKDKKFEQQLEEAYNRTEEDQFVGLFVKNLENVQGDERDIIIMSVCYGFDSRKKMIMNFGPINKKGGEKRLNVIFSRAKKHMAIVSSIKHFHITNEYNEGASYFKRFLHYAELISEGNTATARTILDGLVVSKKDKITNQQNHIVLKQIKEALQKEGYDVDQHVGQSDFKCSLAVKANAGDEEYTLSILIDDDLHYSNENLLEQYYQRPAILQDFGWRVIHVFTKDWMDNPKKVFRSILKRIVEAPVPLAIMDEEVSTVTDTPHVPSLEGENTPLEKEAPPALPSDQFTFERLVFTDATSNKFWETAIDGNKLIVRFGRIGTKGQTQIKSFASGEVAQKEKEKLIGEKTSKGYKTEK